MEQILVHHAEMGRERFWEKKEAGVGIMDITESNRVQERRSRSFVKAKAKRKQREHKKKAKRMQREKKAKRKRKQG